MLPNLTHELKTPLHSILTLVQLLLTEADGPLTAEQRKQLEMVNRNGEHLLELINDLLQFSSMESRTRELVVEEFNPKVLLDAVCDAISPLAEKNQVILEQDYPNLPESFASDRTLIRQIVHNLVSNAVKFTQPEGVVYLFAELTAAQELKLEVVDSGIGIPQEMQRKIFDAFYQAESGESRRFGGVGLGLSLVRVATEALSGKLELVSEEGQGSSFRVTLPQLADQLKRPRILIVESDPILAMSFDEIFSPKRFETRIVSGRTETLESLASWHPNVVLLDLPVSAEGKGSYEILRELRKLRVSEDLPVIVISPLDSPTERAAGFKLGATDYLLKPFDKDELIARVKGSLR